MTTPTDIDKVLETFDLVKLPDGRFNLVPAGTMPNALSKDEAKAAMAEMSAMATLRAENPIAARKVRQRMEADRIRSGTVAALRFGSKVMHLK